jgi:hypothetical protein
MVTTPLPINHRGPAHHIGSSTIPETVRRAKSSKTATSEPYSPPKVNCIPTLQSQRVSVWRTLFAPEYTTKRLTSEAQARMRSIWAAHLTTQSLLLSCHCRQNQSPRSLIKCSNPLKVVVIIFRPHAGRIAFCQLYGRPTISTSATRVPIPGVLIRAMSTCAVSAVVAVTIIMSITSRTHVAVG